MTGRVLQVDQTALQGRDYRLGAVADVQAQQDCADMALHRGFGDAENGRDVFVAFPAGQKREYFPLRPPQDLAKSADFQAWHPPTHIFDRNSRAALNRDPVH